MRLKAGISTSADILTSHVDGESILSFVTEDRGRMVYVGVLTFVLLLGLVGPTIAPYPPTEYHYGEDGILVTQPPSLEHPLGTNDKGQDVLSRVLIGARPTAITGLLGGTILILVGSTIGISAGYLGGRVDAVLMRFTDIMYGIPLLPLAIVLLALFGIGFLESIVVIGLVLWRASARVLRSQVLQIKERDFILAVKAQRAGSFYIVRRHIVPNILPMMAFFFAIGIGGTILIQAGLAFLGVTSPFVPSWGVMIRNAFRANAIDAWWWSLTPGILISLTVYSAIMLGRSIENAEDQRDTVVQL